MQKKVNPFHAYKNKSVIQRISLSGIFFALVILFQFLETYMPFGDTYMNLNFSLLFILPVFYFAGPQYGLGIIVLRLIIGPAMSKLGYSSIGMVSHLILMISSLTAIGFMSLYSTLFHNIKSNNKKLILISISTVISTALILTLLNGLFFTPMYWHVYGYIDSVSIELAKRIYPSISIKFFFIPSYWGGIFVVFLTGNLLKFSLVYVIYFPMSKVLRVFLSKVSN